MSARRLNREGTIRPRSGGRPGFEGRLVWVDELGESHTKWVSGPTRSDVGDKLRALRKDIEDGAKVATKKRTRVTVSTYAEQWIGSTLEASVVARKLTRAEADARASNLRTHVLPRIGDKVLASLTARDLEGLFVDLATKPAKSTHWSTCDGRTKADRKAGRSCPGCRPAGSSTRRRAYFTVRTMLATAHRDGAVRRNVALDVEAPAAEYDKAPPTSLEPEQVVEALDGTADDRLAAVFVLLASTAARREDIVGARWSDFDLDSDEPSWLIPGGKTRAAERTLPLGARAVEALRAHRRRQAEERLAALVWVDSGRVFTMPNGRALRPDYLSRYVRRRSAELGLDATPHRYRHTAISHALDADGVSASQVAEWAGHGSATVTLDIYGHGTRAGSRRLAERMEGLVGRASV